MVGDKCEWESHGEMAKSIIDALAPLQLVTKFCGYSIFTINRFDFSTAFKRTDFIATIWIVFINCFINFYLWNPSQNFPIHKSDIISKSLPIIMCASYGLYLFCIIASMMMKAKLSILIKSICGIDEMVRSFATVFIAIQFHYCSLVRLEFTSIISDRDDSSFAQSLSFCQ